jgi:chromatin structure-remodeling complex subunit RSC9
MTALPAQLASSSRNIGTSSTQPSQASSLHPGTSRAAPIRPSPYTPDLRDLHPGPKNRLFLALRSSLPEEVDWALPCLVAASHDHTENFRLETWVDSVGILQDWPERWVTSLEAEVKLRESGVIILDWNRDENIERRATNALLVLRNASILPTNAKIICRATFLSLLHRFFSLPQDFLLEITIRTPEPVQHILVTLQSIFPHIHASQPVHHIFGRVLPNLLLESRDLGVINLLLPLIISGLTLSGALPPLEDLASHLLNTTTLTPPSPTLDLTLDLLISLTQNPHTAKHILSSPTFPAHLKTLIFLLEHSSKPYTASWDAAKALTGISVRNPASGAWMAEEASRRRSLEREKSQRLISAGIEVRGTVGDKSPGLSSAARGRLYAMAEPQRSISW